MSQIDALTFEPGDLYGFTWKDASAMKYDEIDQMRNYCEKDGEPVDGVPIHFKHGRRCNRNYAFKVWYSASRCGKCPLCQAILFMNLYTSISLSV